MSEQAQARTPDARVKNATSISFRDYRNNVVQQLKMGANAGMATPVKVDEAYHDCYLHFRMPCILYLKTICDKAINKRFVTPENSCIMTLYQVLYA